MPAPKLVRESEIPKIYCHVCSKEMATQVRPFIEKHEEIPPDHPVPMPQLAYTYAVFFIQGMPVSLPVCFLHFVMATKESSLLG